MDGQVANPDPRKCTCHPGDDPPRPCTQKYALHECRVAALADAMWQLLDDMGAKGQSVCLLAKVQARVAFEPFRDKSDHFDDWMTYEEAKAIIAECEAKR